MRVKSNIKVAAKELQKFARQMGRSELQTAMYYMLNEVGNRAVVEHMIMTSGVESAMMQTTHPSKLTVRSGRLARSILEAPSFNRSGLQNRTLEQELGLTPTPHIKGSEEGKEGYKRILFSGKNVEGIIATEVPYAETHEKGKYGMPKRPFLEPAAKEGVEKGRAIFRAVIESGFDRKVGNKTLPIGAL